MGPGGGRIAAAGMTQVMLRGVNLGGWLALEKWMSPAIFAGTDAEDETHLCLALDDVVKQERYRRHRDTWIAESDFVWLAARGLELVRIPVPFFVFGDHGPFLGCADHLDRAFDWAERHGIRLLPELHVVPESQNGFDGGGLCGVCRFHQDPAHVDIALDVLEQLAIRYGDHPSLWGIEVLNEPVSREQWELLDVSARYPPADAARATGSEPVPTAFLKDFYRRAYERIRARSDARVVFHDGFRMSEWVGFLDGAGFENIVVDTHLYVMWHTLEAPESELAEYLAHVARRFGDTLRVYSAYFPILVGEWNVDTKAPKAAGLAGAGRRDYARRLAAAHLAAFAPAVGWCYWSIRNHGPACVADLWDLTRAVELGYLPI